MKRWTKLGIVLVPSIFLSTNALAAHKCDSINERVGNRPVCTSVDKKPVTIDVSVKQNHTAKLKDGQKIAFQLSSYKYARSHTVSDWHMVGINDKAKGLNHKNAHTIYVLNCAVLNNKGIYMRDINCDDNLNVTIKH